MDVPQEHAGYHGEAAKVCDRLRPRRRRAQSFRLFSLSLLEFFFSFFFCLPFSRSLCLSLCLCLCLSVCLSLSKISPSLLP